MDEAKQYIAGLEKKEKSKNESVSEIVAYVDGSYNVAKKIYSYGVVIFDNGEEKHFSECSSDPEIAKMRNVAGEVEGAKKAMEYCLENGASSLDIYFDYQGIESWCTGDWNANIEFTKSYRDFYMIIKNEVKINFYKVLAHSGDEYNDLADELAKVACGIW